MVRAKFYVESITQHKGYNGQPLTTVKMHPVGPKYEGNQPVESENTKFWQASPSGDFTLGMVNKEAAESFEVGKSYYLDISPAEG